MPFLSLSFTNYRNLEDKAIDLLANEVFFIGENGQGKSNLLEALYISAYGSSFRTRIENEIVKNNHTDYSIRALYKQSNEKTDSINVTWKSGKKQIRKNAKIIKDRKEIINTIPCVLFSHDDLDFAIGAPERRRFFIDQSLSMYDILYVDITRKYNKILKSRNSILKNENADLQMLSVYDSELIQTGIQIVKKRNAAILQFNTIYPHLYEEITGIKNVSIKYDSSWKNKSESEINDLLISKREVDKVMHTTMSGPHRDRIKFIKDKKPFISTASTGQQRLAALLLRICQAIHYSEITNKKPVLLMDDVLLELDPDKRQKITALLPEYDQLFCTFLPGEPYERYKHSETRIYTIEEGMWNEVTSGL
ncbi:MAG: DNA recombination protein RecF [Treponema sp. CETP13]|nr:MAG: DNA recombination protein RecF [Treponema sp. CETP13]